MKKLKIRFVQREKFGVYYIQKKTIFGWQFLTWSNYFGREKYENANTSLLLDDVLDRKYNTILKYVKIIEYPTIKMY